LDGQRANAPSNSLGEAVVGPLGLLTILETQLGLVAGHHSQAERIVQLRDCLANADTPDRFYHASLATDALGTAATLLQWRDHWHLHGWCGYFPENSSLRLADLAVVEGQASKLVAPSVGERLAHVLVAMDQRRLTIDQIVLFDPLVAFPKRWQEVLARLPISNAEAATPCGHGFLGQLQGNLIRIASGQSIDKLCWREDGSVIVAQAETRFMSGAWLANQIDEDTQTLLVATTDGPRLDGNLANAGRARHGLSDASAFRPALQVLPLALEILWEPLNFYGLIQFLTHPVCPLPRFARRKLAEKVADKPGIGGSAWDAILQVIDEHYGTENAPAIRDKIRLWVEHPRFRLEEGAPIEVVRDRVRRLANFFSARLGDTDAAKRISFYAAFAQCSACADSLESLERQGVSTIRMRQLQKLVAQATANGTDNPLLVAEVGARLAVTHPGAAIESTDRVIWWQLAMPTLPAPYPWSAAEIRVLAQAGVDLPDNAVRLSQAATEWLRPILGARKQLILVLPPASEELHPLWQMIEAVTRKPVVRSLEQLLVETTSATRPVEHKALPEAKRWWKLPADVTVPLRKAESFSSLELFLFNPYHWLLKYPAALRASRIISLGGDFRMLGNLAHGLVERYYQCADALSMSEQDFVRWFDPAFEQLVTEEGALLRMAGRGADLEGFRHRLRGAMQTLRQQVGRAGIVSVAAEMEVKGSFVGGLLAGSADLVMRKENGQQAIVDMKWSGAKKFPAKLKDNRHLQLAIYAELLRQMQGNWPSVAYYILDRARFVAPDDLTFPDADAVPSSTGENTAQLWQRFLETWKWRQAQVAAGFIEVAVERIEPTDESNPSEDAMAMEYLNEAYNDYQALAGWTL
jgi:hypothetical protein